VVVSSGAVPHLAAAGTDTTPPADPDDSWHVGAAAPAPRAELGGGYGMQWHAPAGPVAAGRELALRFELQDGEGRPVVPEPYMGMPAHAVVVRDDGSVFVHLHPSGTISMASQGLFDSREAGAPPADPHAGHYPPAAGGATLTFPYAFPRAGRYRLWVQVKVEGTVRTGVFDLSVR
jgi:hypothetical protein